MTDTEVTISGNIADTEIDLYADFVENELETVGNYSFEINKTKNKIVDEILSSRKQVMIMVLMMNIFKIYPKTVIYTMM